MSKPIKPKKTIIKYLYYVEGYSSGQIADLFGITRQRILQLKNEKLDKSK